MSESSEKLPRIELMDGEGVIHVFENKEMVIVEEDRNLRIYVSCNSVAIFREWQWCKTFNFSVSAGIFSPKITTEVA